MLQPHFPGNSIVSRNSIIYLLTITVLLPLCSLRNLDALKFSSILGLAGTVYSVLFAGKRYFDGSYRPDGAFYNELPSNLLPSFGDKLSVSNSRQFRPRCLCV
jgi:amino acid permease